MGSTQIDASDLWIFEVHQLLLLRWEAVVLEGVVVRLQMGGLVLVKGDLVVVSAMVRSRSSGGRV